MGFHWTACRNPFSALVPIGVLILCLITAPELPSITRELIHGVEWCCAILSAGMVLTSATYVVLEKLLMPRTIFVRGNHKYIRMVTAAEARDEYERHVLYPEEITIGSGHSAIPPSNRVAVLPRSAYEWKAD